MAVEPADNFSPITPDNLRGSSCPICEVPAAHFHCPRCRWLACRSCKVVWSERTKHWISVMDVNINGVKGELGMEVIVDEG